MSFINSFKNLPGNVCLDSVFTFVDSFSVICVCCVTSLVILFDQRCLCLYFRQHVRSILLILNVVRARYGCIYVDGVIFKVIVYCIVLLYILYCLLLYRFNLNLAEGVTSPQPLFFMWD